MIASKPALHCQTRRIKTTILRKKCLGGKYHWHSSQENWLTGDKKKQMYLIKHSEHTLFINTL